MNTETFVNDASLVNAILYRRKRKCIAQDSHAPIAVTTVTDNTRVTTIKCERCGL